MDTSLIPVAVAAIAAFGGYLIAVRRASGHIQTSEASELWAESRSIREWSQARIDSLEKQVEKLEHRIDTLYAENGSLNSQLTELRQTCRDQEFTIAGHEQTIKELTEQLELAKGRVTEIEKRPNGG